MTVQKSSFAFAQNAGKRFAKNQTKTCLIFLACQLGRSRIFEMRKDEFRKREISGAKMTLHRMSAWILMVSSLAMSVAELPSDNDEKEENSSPKSMPDFPLFGDMKLTDHQRVLLDIPIKADDGSVPGKPPAATREKTLLWENGIIPYVFDCSLHNMPELQRIIRLAMNDWESKTCIKFVPRKDEEKEKDYVTFLRGSHCYSTVGKARSERREVSAGYGCEYHHVMVHELGHVIGFWHEQSRPDRDEHVRIVWKNVVKGWEHAFLKQTWQAVDSMKTVYDYSSIMHYKFNAFSRSPRRKTIQPLLKIRARPYKRISRLDALQVNMMYNCNAINQRHEYKNESTNKIPNRKRRAITENLVNIRGKDSQPKRQAGTKEEIKIDPNCRDTMKACAYWAKKGFCELRRDFMPKECKKSCNSCDAVNKTGEEKPETECMDIKTNCPFWAEHGYCEKRPDYMTVKCRKSCGFCTEERCLDRDPRCRAWARWKYCTSDRYRHVMLQACRRSCAFCVAETHDCKDKIPLRCPRLKEEGYCKSMKPDVRLDMRNMCALTCGFCRKIKQTAENPRPTVKPACVDTFKGCYGWSRLGYCSSNWKGRFMRDYCKRSCNLCVPIDPEYTGEKCLDNDISCESLKREGYCEKEEYKNHMEFNCKRTCNLCRRRIAMPPTCRDKHVLCKYWSNRGDCCVRSRYMILNCPLACNICHKGIYDLSANPCYEGKPCFDRHTKCSEWTEAGYCDIYSNFMYKKCPMSCEACYPENKLAKPCKNELDDANCEHWAGMGYCQSRPEIMIYKCQHACNSCPKEPVKIRPAQPKGIKCGAACKKWLERGQCTTKWKRRCLRTCLALGCDDEPVRPEGACSEPLGVGWNFTLPDSAFHASSSLIAGTWDFGAHNARLYKEDDRMRSRIGAWCAKHKDSNQWLQVDLGKIKFVTAVATQGRDKYFEHVKSYELAFSKDGQRWNHYKENGRRRVLPGNCDNFTPVINRLIRPIQARFIRFYPRTYNNICMRVEIYGCSRHKGYEKQKTPPPVNALLL
ncbi:uncharacterized protein [Montipora foliosa]|uniref:uncharacterized protein isoform X1 n=2 Tax=Montipora foliosa TaxID=591990 RepID=UPI0035F1C5DF